MSWLQQQFVLDQLPDDVIIQLCTTSKTLRASCVTQLRSRVSALDPADSIVEFIKIKTLTDKNFVVAGSEIHLGLDEALYRAVASEDITLVNHFLRRSPEANKGSESRHVILLAFAAILENKRDILKDVIISCVDAEVCVGWEGAVPLLEYLHALARLCQCWDLVSLLTEFRPQQDPVKSVICAIYVYDSTSLVRRLLSMPSLKLDKYEVYELGSVVGTTGDLDLVQKLEIMFPGSIEYMLRSAARHGHLNVLRELLSTHIKLRPEAALQDAIDLEQIPVIQYIIENYPELNQIALEHTINNGNSEIFDYLIFIGVRPDEVSRLLYQAINAETWSAISYLLKCIDVEDVYDIVGREHSDVAKIIIDEDPRLDLDEVLYNEVKKNTPNMEVIKHLIIKGVCSEKALDAAKEMGLLEIVELLG